MMEQLATGYGPDRLLFEKKLANGHGKITTTSVLKYNNF